MLCSTSLILSLTALCAAAGEPSEAVQVRMEQDMLCIEMAGKPLMRYQLTENPFKPYVQELFTPAGVNVLRDAPHDHLHHHALMFAIGVNGVSFWAETPECGRQLHKSIAVLPGPSPAGFTQTLQWQTPEGVALLEEQRIIHVAHDAPGGATLLFWESSLKTPEGADAVTLTGSHYYGLGMRFLESMDSGGTFLYAAENPGEIVRGDERLTPSPWCAYTAQAGGKPVTAAMFDHPENPRHPALWFTMQTPFAYLSATRNLWKEPMPLKPGNFLRFRHAVALWDGVKDETAIRETHARLAALWP